MNKLYIKSMEEIRDNLVYKHTINPIGKYYIGITGNSIKDRKKKSYERCSLQPYLDEYGWDNINTTIVADGLTRKEAELLEDQLIREGWKNGDCINKVGSGGERRDNPKEYDRKRDKTKERIECHRLYDRKRNSTTERLIYRRVYDYNRKHTPIETPMEAKLKYLESGYIPCYIKNDDLL